ncbi:MAG: hypothetical protein K6C31_03020 [Bacteroidales bacterium]|nr:hypothetical protein [Bacteroidales bacterium]
MAVAATAISFFVIIIAVTVAAGFRKEIRGGVRALTGDVILTGAGSGSYNGENPIACDSAFLSSLKTLDGVASADPVVYRAAIVRNEGKIQGILIKAVPSSDSLSLQVSIPKKLSTLLGLAPGDRMNTYFVGDRLRARTFTVSGIYDSLVETDDRLVVFAAIDDLRRVNGWDEGQASAVEITLEPGCNEGDAQRLKAAAIGIAATGLSGEDARLYAQAAEDRYSSLFNWLDLVDFNVLAILVLMTVVAGFNMISGLLIMLFRNIHTIGTLKALGMNGGGISAVFLRVASRIVLKGMLAGNALALLFCLVQGRTHLLKLNPENYFVSFVPVSVSIPQILLVDAWAYLVIMLLLLIPCLFISRVDPAETVRVR